MSFSIAEQFALKTHTNVTEFAALKESTMRRRLPIDGAIITLLMLTLHRADAAEIKILEVSISAQQMSNWCWAATSQMAMEFKGRHQSQDVSQCRQASKRLNRSPGTDCCGATLDCDVSGWPIFGQFEFTAKKTARKPLPWNTIKDEINADRPCCASIKWTDGNFTSKTGHMLIVRGYEVDDDGTRYVHLIDPEPIPDPGAKDPDLRRGGDAFRVKYDDYVACPTPRKIKRNWGPYIHWNDYYMIQPK